MLLFTRPTEPPNFATRVAKSKQAVQQHMGTLLKAGTQQGAGAPPAGGGVAPAQPKKKTKADVFQPKWSGFKDAFSKAQYGRCAYCEVSVIGAQHGDVEHYYPKAQLQALHDDPSTWGREKPYLSNVEGRQTKVLCDTGYWWLAYEWSNYLLSCLVCNEYWKGAIFPVEDDPRKLPPCTEVAEVALLLNPFEDIEPVGHVSFNDLGQIYAVNKSRRGSETIRTCGLDRLSLTNIRGGIARETHYLADRLSDAETPGQLKDALYSLYLKGVETNHHPGMVRIIVEHRTGLSWTDIVDQLARLLTSDLLGATGTDEEGGVLCQLYEIGNEDRADSGLVHAVLAEECGKTWETLVGELASFLTNSFNASGDAEARGSALRFLHEMGAEGHSHSAAVRDIVAIECGLRWVEVEAAVRVAAHAAFNKS